MLHFADKLKVFWRGDMKKGVRATAAFKNVCEFEADLLTKEQFEVAGKGVPGKAYTSLWSAGTLNTV